MKKSALTMFVMISSFAVISCGNGASKTSDDNNQSSSVHSTEKTDLQIFLSHYYHLKDALVKSDGVEAARGAETMLKELPNVEIKSGEHATHFEQIIAEIKDDLEHITSTQTVSHQRDHFKTLSNNVYELLKINGSIGETVYRQHCPMAFENQGAYWLSSEKEIRNPYFGNKMLKCGSVEETLN